MTVCDIVVTLSQVFLSKTARIPYKLRIFVSASYSLFYVDIVDNSYLSTVLAILRTFSRILHFRSAYAIMPVGKEKRCFHIGHQQKPRRLRLRGFLFLLLALGRLNPIGWLPVTCHRPAICR